MMKRKREHEAAAATPTTQTTEGPKLTDMADELIAAVLSYFHFYERPKYCLVCRRLMNVVDAMPPPPDSSLEIQIVASEREDEPRAGPTPWNIVCDEDRNTVQATFAMSEEEDGTILASLPHFGTVRPSKLDVKSFVQQQGVDIRLVSHLANTVGGTVTDLHVRNLAPCNVIELQKTFFAFGDNVKRLYLSTLFPLALAASAITCLSKLTSVTLALRNEMVPGDLERPDSDAQHVGLLPLGLLSSLPCLGELEIREENNDDGLELMSVAVDDTVIASLTLGCACLSRLKRLSSVILDDKGAKSREAFAWMLRRLPLLTDLSMVFNPEPELWRGVSAVGGHKMLRKLAIYYYLQPVAALDALVSSCNRCFPSLEQLELHLEDMEFDFEELVHSLSGLKSHKTLSSLKCSLGSGFRGSIIEYSTLQEALGEHIEVTGIPLFSFSDN